MNTILSVLAVALTSSAVNAIEFSIDTSSAACDGSPFSTKQIEVSCGDEGAECGMGDTAIITGNFTADVDFYNVDVTLQPCLEEYCPEESAIVAGSICDWIEPVEEGQECGSAGDYVVMYELYIPGEEDNISNDVTVIIKVETGDDCGAVDEEEDAVVEVDEEEVGQEEAQVDEAVEEGQEQEDIVEEVQQENIDEDVQQENIDEDVQQDNKFDEAGDANNVEYATAGVVLALVGAAFASRKRHNDEIKDGEEKLYSEMKGSATFVQLE